MLKWDAHIKTITFDNGKEFSEHEQVAAALNVDCYFAHPYSSWERGTNENTNGLIRQYLPKDRNLKNVSMAEEVKIMDKLNLRPRKYLGFRTPYEVFFDLQKVALTSVESKCYITKNFHTIFSSQFQEHRQSARHSCLDIQELR